MQILIVERKRYNAYHSETVLRDNDGKVKKQYKSMLSHPKKGQKTVVIRGKVYQLDWSKVEIAEKKKVKKK